MSDMMGRNFTSKKDTYVGSRDRMDNTQWRQPHPGSLNYSIIIDRDNYCSRSHEFDTGENLGDKYSMHKFAAGILSPLSRMRYEIYANSGD
jgi:hypothetical protein